MNKRDGQSPVNLQRYPNTNFTGIDSSNEREDDQTTLDEQRGFTCHLDKAGIITQISCSYCSYFGKGEEELIGKNYFHLLPKNNRDEIRRCFSTFSPNNTVITYDLKTESPDGETRWQYYRNRAEFDKKGKITDILVSGWDITKRRRSEESLLESERRYRAIVEDQIELVCRYKPDGTLTFANKSYCRHYGKQGEDLIGKSFLPFISDNDRLIFLKLVKTVSPKNPISTQIQCITNNNGKILWQEWRRRAFFDSEGKLVEFQSVGRDITERIKAENALKQSEQILQRQKKELEQKNIALKEMLEIIAREKQQIKDEVIANIDELLLPLLNQMNLKEAGVDQSKTEALERTLKQLASSFGKKITQPGLHLTRREIDICNLIKNGFSSKEIAEILHIALNTIGRHRNNIRRKVGIANKKTRLSSFLLNL